MNKYKNRARAQGYTLLEMLLVLVIMSAIIQLVTNYGTARMSQYRRDRAAAQMQQILNAGLNYYISNGKWPVQTCGTGETLSAGTSLLQANGYLPPTPMKSPFAAAAYTINCADPPAGLFSVSVTINNLGDAQILVGELPVASYTGSGPYVVKAQVQIPGQNLNNARSINFGAIYHHGACVPVPACPSTMQAEIIVAPSSVGGVNDAPTQDNAGATPCTSTSIYQPGSTTPSGTAGNCAYINYYPISNFSAYSTAPAAASAVGVGPASCDGAAASAGCYSNISGSGVAWTAITDSQQYWRVCLKIITEKGPVAPSSTGYGSGNNQNLYWNNAMGEILVTTRCATTGEPSGSDLTVSGH